MLMLRLRIKRILFELGVIDELEYIENLKKRKTELVALQDKIDIEEGKNYLDSVINVATFKYPKNSVIYYGSYLVFGLVLTYFLGTWYVLVGALVIPGVHFIVGQWLSRKYAGAGESDRR